MATARAWQFAAWLALAGAAPAAAQPAAPVELDLGSRDFTLVFVEAMRTLPNEIPMGLVSVDGFAAPKCYWEDDTDLACDLPDDQEFRKASTYHVRIGAGLYTQAGAPVPATTLVGETERPHVDVVLVEWTGDVPKLVVHATPRATQAAIEAVLRARVDGRDWSYRLEPLPDSGNKDDDEEPVISSFALHVAPIPGSNRKLAFEELPGLRSVLGSLPGKGGKRLDLVVQEPPRLRNAACPRPDGKTPVQPLDGKRLAITCLPEEPITLEFSHPLDRASLQRWVATWPSGIAFVDAVPLPWRWSNGPPRRPGERVRLRVDAPVQSLALAVPADLRTLAGATVARATLAIATTHRQPRLEVAQQRTLLPAPPADGTYAHAIAANELKVALLGIGAGVESGQLDAPMGARDESMPVPSALTQRVLDEGGWVRWTVETRPEQSYQRAVQFAAPDFDLIATFGSRDVLVWANAWDRDAPIAGADVELLRLGKDEQAPTVVARGTTVVDGTALLRLPDDYATPRDERSSAQWLVRAATPAVAMPARAVLPLGEPWNVAIGAASDDRLWGVTDRPMYRAGDTVKYRLWLREERDGRLRRPRRVAPMPLQLHDRQDELPIANWDAPVDASGAASGEVRLPVHLPDGDYCIARQGDAMGACFFVGTFRGQDLWVELKLDRPLVREGDVLAIDAQAGYYSSGPATGVAMHLQTVLRAWPIDEAYPEFGKYTFGDPRPDDMSDDLLWDGAEAQPLIADGDGRVRGAWPFRVRPKRPSDDPLVLPWFGRLQVTAEAKANDREGTHSPIADATFARIDRFVGLRVGAGWHDARVASKLEAVVVSALGKTVADATVEVEVVYRKGSGGDDSDDVPVGRCRLRVGIESPCAFPRTRSGHYIFKATSADALPTELWGYFWAGMQAADTDNPAAHLDLIARPAAPGSDASLRLRQPFATARVLLVARGSRWLSHRVVQVGAGGTPLALPTGKDWTGDVNVRAIVRSGETAADRDGVRMPVKPLDAEVMLPLGRPEAVKDPVSIAFLPSRSGPGATVRLRVRNDGDQARDVVLAVVDDAVRALAADIRLYTDPFGNGWLGEDISVGSWGMHSFAGWQDTTAVRLQLGWIDGPVQGLRSRTMMRVPPGSLSAYEVRGFNEDGPVEIQPEEFQYSGSGELDSIVVTGTRIRFQLDEGATRVAGVKPRESGPGRKLARVRSDFRDAALWVPDLRLAPGEERTFDVVLPDNLTRWHATAWSSDADDGFAVAEATLEAGLPIEVRLQAPVRVYPGDQSRVAANVRRSGPGAGAVAANLQADGAGVQQAHAESIALAAGAQDSLGLAIAPTGVGQVTLLADANAREGGDAVGASIDVESPQVPVTIVQAGWLADAGIVLPLPALPASAGPAQLRVALHRGGSGLVERWTQDMAAYPHRCWEQILSRGVAAALALARKDASWPDADAVVREALENAAVFQDEDGGFRYFVQPQSWERNHDYSEPPPQVALTAYSVRALAWLRGLGHPVDAHVEARAHSFLVDHADDAADDSDDADEVDDASGHEHDLAIDQQALALGALPDADADSIDSAWAHWERQSLPAKLATARAMRGAGHAKAGKAIDRLLALAPRRGGARRLAEDPRGLRWMGSALHEQCELIALLDGADATAAQRRARGEMLAGLTNLYAGGIEAIDTQAGAQCLYALGRATATDAPPRTARATLGDAAHELRIDDEATQAQWTTPAVAGSELRIVPTADGAQPDSYLAELSYVEDAREARAAAVGLAIERRYEVFRDADWKPVDGIALRESDWIRITLVVSTGAPRHFVAVTDAVPGGLQPSDLQLRGVGGVQLEAMSDPGSGYFETRRLDPRAPKFYAEYLPAGRHEVRYFARVGNSGDYLAAPAVAELMYGGASRARTAAQRLKIEDDDAP